MATGGFVLWPAIDLREGRCVRLVQGDPDRQTVFGEDPVAMARHWVRAGAQALHVVDLDGAFAGAPRQLELLGAIAAAVPVPVQFGGGLRSERDVAAALEAGAARVVVGTRALEAGFLVALRQRWGGERIVAGLDARGDHLAIAGWRQQSSVDLMEAAGLVLGAGIELAVFTQVERDGLLGGPDLPRIRALAATGLGVVASGGVSSAEDLRALVALAPLGVRGAIVGRALYDGRLTLDQALAAAGA